MKTLITGIAGFIGYFTARECLKKGHEVVGIDNINAYYQTSLKVGRIQSLGLHQDGGASSKYSGLRFLKMDLIDQESMETLFKDEKFDVVVHLAAQAGVRHSMEEPRAYVQSNVEGFLNVLEGCRRNQVKHLIYASSSSVYGLNRKVPFQTSDPVDHPINIYAATKRSGELMAHAYSHLYGVPSTGLRFFTVYGPWGRPDMAPFLFIESIMNGQVIKVFNNGNMERDFTYVDDIVEAMVKTIPMPPKRRKAHRPDTSSTAPFKIYNIGKSSPTDLLDFIKIIEKYTKQKAKKTFMPTQMGDMVRTYADVEDLFHAISFKPTTSLDEGIKRTVTWHKEHQQK